MGKIIIRHAWSKDIPKIGEIQTQNLRQNLPPEVQEREGFVSLETEKVFLHEAVRLGFIFVAVEENTGKIVGYIIGMDQQLAYRIKFLEDLLDACALILSDSDWLLVAQICVDVKFHGKQGVAERLYEALKKTAVERGYDNLGTAVTVKNAC